MKKFFTTLKSELKSLHYPTGKEVVSSAKYVIAASVIIAGITSFASLSTSQLVSLIVTRFF